jgi:hypothetical protein
MLEEGIAQAVKIVFNYGVLGVVAVGLGWLYYRATLKIDSLNLVILELTRSQGPVIEKNSAALQNVAAALERATEAQRDLAESIRRYADRAGVA